MNPSDVIILAIISFVMCFGGFWIGFGSLSDFLGSLWDFIKSDVIGWLPWVIGASFLYLLSSLIPDSHDRKREESARIYAKRQALNKRVENELWRLKSGKQDDGTLARAEKDLQDYQDQLEIAPGEGVYLRERKK